MQIKLVVVVVVVVVDITTLGVAVVNMCAYIVGLTHR